MIASEKSKKDFGLNIIQPLLKPHLSLAKILYLTFFHFIIENAGFDVRHIRLIIYQMRLLRQQIVYP